MDNFAQLLLFRPGQKPEQGATPADYSIRLKDPKDLTMPSSRGLRVYQYVGTVTEVRKPGQARGYVVGRGYCAPGNDAYICIAETMNHSFIFRCPDGHLREITPDGKIVNKGPTNGLNFRIRPDVAGPEEVTYELVKE